MVYLRSTVDGEGSLRAYRVQYGTRNWEAAYPVLLSLGEAESACYRLSRGNDPRDRRTPHWTTIVYEPRVDCPANPVDAL